jgi:hypothetical protein
MLCFIMGGEGSDTAERRWGKGGYATEYLAYLGLLVTVVAVGLVRRDVADLNAESAVDQQVADGVKALSDGEPRRAIQILGGAVKAAPEHVNAHVHLAMALETAHDEHAAREVWLEVMEMAEVRRDSNLIRLARTRLDKLEAAAPSAALPAPSAGQGR